MTTYTIGSDGDDYASWTALQVANPEVDGDIVSFRKGETFRETITVPASGSSTSSVITYTAHGEGADPKILGSELMMTWITHDTNVWKKTGVTTQPYVVVFGGTWGEYESGGIGSLNVEKEWYWASDVLYVYTTGGDPDSQWPSGIEVGQRDYGIIIQGKDYINVDNLDIRNSNNNAVHMNTATYCEIDSCYIWGHAGRGIYGYAITNNVIKDNTILYFANGFGVEAVSDSNTIEGNEIGQSRDTARMAGGGALLFYNSDSNIIRYNYLHDARLVGSDRQGDGVYLNTDGDCNSNEFYYNLIVRFNDGIDISGDGNEIYNNIFYEQQAIQYHIDEPATNNVIKNNIFYDSTNADWMINTGNTPAASNTIENNCYYDPDNPDGSTDCITWNATDEAWGNMTWVEWVAHSKYDQNSIYTDPLFVDAANDDFRLLMVSPCVNAGTDVSLTRDYRGRSIRHAPDIGAYEDPTNALF